MILVAVTAARREAFVAGALVWSGPAAGLPGLYMFSQNRCYAGPTAVGPGFAGMQGRGRHTVHNTQSMTRARARFLMLE